MSIQTGTCRLTLPALRKMKQDRQPIVALTAYDYSFARLLDQSGIDHTGSPDNHPRQHGGYALPHIYRQQRRRKSATGHGYALYELSRYRTRTG